MTKNTISTNYHNHSPILSENARKQSSIQATRIPVLQIPNPYITEPTKHTIPASHGHAAALKAGTSFRLVDLRGEQVIDMSAFVLPFPNSDITTGSMGAIASAEHLSASYTRFHYHGQPIAIGEHIYTNMDRKLLKLTHDTVKVHDMTFMSCFPRLYEARGFKPGEHRACASNMLEAFSSFGMEYLTETRDPFNVFQNTPNYSLKPINTSRAGDYCQFEVLIDCVVGWSCCPYDLDGFNGGKVTDVQVLMGLDPKESRSSEEIAQYCLQV